MKISVYDSWNGKFSSDIVEHWRSLGHEVSFNGKYDELSDVAFFYQSDNATQVGVKEVKADKIYVQCVDIEVHAGQAAGIDWTKVDGAIFMAEHIREMVDTKGTPTALIKPGIDLTKFTLQEKREETPVKRIAYVVGERRIWDVKRLDIAFQMLHDVRKMKPEFIWQLHVRGTYSSHEQYNRYCQYLEKDLELKDFVVWHKERVEDLNEWLEDKDYFLLPSTKEAFSYATAEAMAKGIKPVINNWEGSKKTWGRFVSNSYMEMLERLCEDTYEPEVYRKYVEDNYNSIRYFSNLDEAILGL